MEKIDPLFLLQKNAFYSINTTRILFTSEELSNWIKESKLVVPDSTKNFPFITEIFFLTQYSLHFGPIRTINLYQEFLQHIARLDEKKKQLQNSRNFWSQVYFSFFFY